MQDTPLDPPRIRDSDSLRQWLRGQSREASLNIATRAALRVLPLTVEVRAKVEDWSSDVMLPLFRAVTTSWLASQDLIQSDDALAASSRAATRATATAVNVVTSVSAAHAARSAALAAVAKSNASMIASVAQVAELGSMDIASSMWTAVQRDAAVITNGDPLSRAPLWHWDKTPSKVAEKYSMLRECIEGNDDWDVWLDWYEARLRGRDPLPALEFERAVSALSLGDWSQGPAHVNAKIKAALKDAEGPLGEAKLPVVPEERPAPAHFAVVEDVLVLASRLPPDLSDEQRIRARAAHRSLREAFEDFSEIAGAAQQRGVMRVIERCENALGPDFHAVDVIRLGHHAARLQAHADRADEIYLAETAAELVGLNSQLSLFMAQFNEWADYLAGARDPLAAAEAEQEAAQLGAAMIRVLRNHLPEAINENARTELEVQADEATGEDDAEGVPAEQAATSRRSFLRSLRSAIRGFAVFIVENYQKGAGKGIEDVARTTSVAAIAAIKVELLALARIIPAEYAWVEGVVTLVVRLLG